MDQFAFPRYEDYKPSGLDWLGEIPAHWEVLPFKALFQMSTEKNGKNIVGEMLSVSGYRGIEVKHYEHEEQKRAAEELADYRVVRQGQLVVNTMWLNYAGLGVSSLEGHVSPAYRSYNVSEQLHGRYAHYLMRSHVYVEGYTGQMQGIRPNSLQIKNCDFNKFPILVPSHEEQQRIANFLDQKTAEIDEAIAKKQRLIELLKEEKAILINQAVTKGLNPDVPMRDSGVEWIGSIPLLWATNKLKHLVRFVSGGTPSKSNPKYWGGDIPWVSPKDMKIRYLSDAQDHITNLAVERSGIKLISDSCVLIVVRGMILARIIPVALPLVPVTINQDMKAMLTLGNISSEYLVYLLSGLYEELSVLLEESGHGTKTLPTEKLGGFPLPVPPVEEQGEIVTYAKKIEKEFGALVTHTEQQIGQLKEFRQSVVAEAVTGKIKL